MCSLDEYSDVRPIKNGAEEQGDDYYQQCCLQEFLKGRTDEHPPISTRWGTPIPKEKRVEMARANLYMAIVSTPLSKKPKRKYEGPEYGHEPFPFGKTAQAGSHLQ